MSAAAFKTFYEKRHKELRSKDDHSTIGTYHIYDEEGNLITKNKEGAIQETLVIPSYRPPSLEELSIMEHERKERIALATKAYDEAFEALHQEYQRKDRSIQDVLARSRRMVEADHQLQHARYPLRRVNRLKGIEIRRVLFDEENEVRKLPYSLAVLRLSPFPLQELYVREGALPASASASASTTSTASMLNKPVLIIQDVDTNEYGFMSLDWPVQIRLSSITYHSAKQALAAELAKSFHDDEGFRKILDAQTPAEVSYKMEDAKEATPDLWASTTKKHLYTIQEAKFRQYPELTSRLLATGDAVLAVYLPHDDLLGIGIAADDPRAKNPLYWKGQNLLGSILMEIRGKLKEELEEAPAPVPAPDQKKRFSGKRPVAASKQKNQIKSNTKHKQNIEVIGTIFNKTGMYGDFEWQINSGQYEDALFLFNDSEDYHTTNRAGKGNAIIRKYNKYSNLPKPRSAGINTGKTIQQGGYTQLDDRTKRVIDLCIQEARDIINQYDYKRVFYSADANGRLGTGLFVVSPDVIEYITQQILSLSNI